MTEQPDMQRAVARPRCADFVWRGWERDRCPNPAKWLVLVRGRGLQPRCGVHSRRYLDTRKPIEGVTR